MLTVSKFIVVGCSRSRYVISSQEVGDIQQALAVQVGVVT
jgi:hypothetical protein